MKRVIIVMVAVLGLTLGAFPASTLTDVTKNAAACSDKDKGTSKDKGQGEQT